MNVSNLPRQARDKHWEITQTERECVFQVSTGVIATLFSQRISFKRPMRVDSLFLMSTSGKPSPALDTTTLLLCATRHCATPRRVVNISSVDQAVEMVIETGGWFGLWSPAVSNAQLFSVRGAALRVRVIAPRHDPAWFTVTAAATNATSSLVVNTGDTFVTELAQLGLSLTSQLPSVDSLIQLHDFLRNPPITVMSGPQLECALICDSVVNRSSNFTTELLAPRYVGDRDMMLPLRVGGLNPRWSAGLWQKHGFPGSAGAIYGNGTDRYTALGVEEGGGRAFVPLYVGEAATRVVVGHPVIADGDRADELFIQVTHVDASPSSVWHVSLNNPTNATIRAMVHVAMTPARFALRSQVVELEGGQDVVLM
jgi:hypothetical protein